MNTELKEQIIAVIELGLELADPKRFTMANRIDIEHVLGKVKKLDLPVVNNSEAVVCKLKIATCRCIGKNYRCELHPPEKCSLQTDC